LRNTITGVTEQSVIGGCLADLVVSIKELMGARNYVLVENRTLVSEPGTVLDQPELTEYIFNWGIYCIDNQVNCVLPNRDTLYSWIPQAYVLGPGFFYFVVGVNHNDLDKTIYNSVTTYYVQDPLVPTDIYTPIQSLSNFDYDQFDFTQVVPAGECTNAQRQNLFAIQVARPAQIINGIAAMSINETQLGNAQPFIFFSRAHLNPNTKTHPDLSEVMLPQVLIFHYVPV